MYRVFDVVVASEVVLHGAPTVSAPVADISVSLAAGRPDTDGFEPVHAWRDDDGELSLSCARRTGRYLLYFPEGGDFLISADSVTCHPAPTCTPETLSHLVLDQVLPRLQAHRGDLVLHASAVCLPDGDVVAFCGPSGSGKSTLAAALQRRGARLLGDDCLAVRVGPAGAQVVAAYPGLRLHRDAIEALGIEQMNWATMAHYSGKRRTPLSSSAGFENRRLDRIYMLGGQGRVDGTELEPLGGAEASRRLIEQSFLLDVDDVERAAQQLQAVANLQSAIEGVYSLAHKHDFKHLNAVCEILLQKPEGLQGNVQ